MVFNMTGNGDGLNFAVKQYTATPTGTAKENTIGVVTDTAITSWVMQAEQPEGVEGLVWIEVAAASDVAFFADRKHQVKLYPKSVNQYVSGAWENKEAYVYQNGAWVLFSQTNVYYYDEGDLCESVTGGWKKTGYQSYTVTFASDHILLHVQPNSDTGVKSRAAAATINKIDLTNISTLNCTVDSVTKYAGSTPEVYLCVASTVSTTGQGEYNAKVSGASDVSRNINLDVSSVTGNWYVYVQLMPTSDTSYNTSNMTASVSKVWGE